MESNKEPTKLIYVLPAYIQQTHEHLAHNYELLDELGRHLQLFLIIEKGTPPVNIKNLHGIYFMQHQEPGITLGKIFEFAWLILRLYWKGYSKLYAHYSNLGAIIGSIILRPLGGCTYYWHCFGDQNYFNSIEFRHNPDRQITQLALKLTSRYVAGTSLTGQMYANAFGFSSRKIVVLPNWVNESRFSRERTLPFDLPKRPVVLFVHRLEKPRGVLELPTIASIVVEKVPDALFLVAGDGTLRLSLESEIRRLGLEAHFRILGSIPNNELPALFAASDVFIMPSHTECFPRVVLEALAMRVPMVVTNVGGVPEILPPDYKTLVTPVGEWSRFAENIIFCLTQSETANSLASVGYKHFQTHYTLAVVARKFSDLILCSS